MIATLTVAACLAISPGSSEILARDLAPAWPALRALAPDTPLALAPLPGVVRVFRPLELGQLAARWHLGLAPGTALCVAWPVKTLDPQRLLEAMRRSLPTAAIEILDFSRQPAPEGPLEFPRSHLWREAGAALWNGWITYAGNRRFYVWARVRVTESVSRVVALADLLPGKPVTTSQVSAVIRQEFPNAEPYARSLAEVVGRWPSRPIPAGAAVRTDQLTEPRVILMGDTVQVEVHDGGAFLKMEGRAESAGAVGEIVSVRNPSSHQLIRARVLGPGKATLDSARRASLDRQADKELQP
ncbi:MAG: flagellar basal body P-ring formation chaperone FlgA [Bryobacteraceae bacterium]